MGGRESLAFSGGKLFTGENFHRLCVTAFDSLQTGILQGVDKCNIAVECRMSVFTPFYQSRPVLGQIPALIQTVGD